MSGLSQLQRDFSEYVLRERAGIAEKVMADETAPVAQRLDVYREGYRLRLIEVLTGDFPGLLQLAGNDTFDSLCRRYIDAQPSTHFNIRWFGGGLPEFLRHPPGSANPPAWVEMADLEWALTLAFDAVDESLATMTHAAALTPDQWPRMCLRVAASIQRRQFSFNVGAVRRAIDRNEPPPVLQALESTADWVVWRLDRGVFQRQMQADEAAALDAARRGASFGEICGTLCEWHDEDQVALQAAGFLKLWIEQQWIAELVVGDDEA